MMEKLILLLYLTLRLAVAEDLDVIFGIIEEIKSIPRSHLGNVFSVTQNVENDRLLYQFHKQTIFISKNIEQRGQDVIVLNENEDGLDFCGEKKTYVVLALQNTETNTYSALYAYRRYRGENGDSVIEWENYSPRGGSSRNKAYIFGHIHCTRSILTSCKTGKPDESVLYSKNVNIHDTRNTTNDFTCDLSNTIEESQFSGAVLSSLNMAVTILAGAEMIYKDEMKMQRDIVRQLMDQQKKASGRSFTVKNSDLIENITEIAADRFLEAGKDKLSTGVLLFHVLIAAIGQIAEKLIHLENRNVTNDQVFEDFKLEMRRNLGTKLLEGLFKGDYDLRENSPNPFPGLLLKTNIAKQIMFQGKENNSQTTAMGRSAAGNQGTRKYYGDTVKDGTKTGLRATDNLQFALGNAFGKDRDKKSAGQIFSENVKAGYYTSYGLVEDGGDLLGQAVGVGKINDDRDVMDKVVDGALNAAGGAVGSVVDVAADLLAPLGLGPLAKIIAGVGGGALGIAGGIAGCEKGVCGIHQLVKLGAKAFGAGGLIGMSKKKKMVEDDSILKLYEKYIQLGGDPSLGLNPPLAVGVAVQPPPLAVGVAVQPPPLAVGVAMQSPPLATGVAVQQQPPPVGVTMEQPPSVGVALEQPPPVGVTVEQPPSVGVAVEQPPSIGVTVEQPSVGVGVEGQRPSFGVGVEGQRPSFGVGVDGQNPSVGVGVEGQRPSFGVGVDGQNPSVGVGVDGQNPSVGVGVDGQKPSFGVGVDGLKTFFGVGIEGQKPSFAVDVDGQRPSYAVGVEGQKPSFGVGLDGQKHSHAVSVDGRGSLDAVGVDGHGSLDAVGVDGQETSDEVGLDGQETSDEVGLDGQKPLYVAGVEGQKPSFEEENSSNEVGVDKVKPSLAVGVGVEEPSLGMQFLEDNSTSEGGVDKKKSSLAVGVKLPSLAVGTKKPSLAVGVKKPSHKVGVKQPSHKVGVKHPSGEGQSNAKVNFQLATDVKLPSLGVGAIIPSFGMGAKIPSLGVGGKTPSLKVGVKLPSLKVGVNLGKPSLGMQFVEDNSTAEVGVATGKPSVAPSAKGRSMQTLPQASADEAHKSGLGVSDISTLKDSNGETLLAPPLEMETEVDIFAIWGWLSQDLSALSLWETKEPEGFVGFGTLDAKLQAINSDEYNNIDTFEKYVDFLVLSLRIDNRRDFSNEISGLIANNYVTYNQDDKTFDLVERFGKILSPEEETNLYLSFELAAFSNAYKHLADGSLLLKSPAGDGISKSVAVIQRMTAEYVSSVFNYGNSHMIKLLRNYGYTLKTLFTKSLQDVYRYNTCRKCTPEIISEMDNNSITLYGLLQFVLFESWDYYANLWAIGNIDLSQLDIIAVTTNYNSHFTKNRADFITDVSNYIV